MATLAQNNTLNFRLRILNFTANPPSWYFVDSPEYHGIPTLRCFVDHLPSCNVDLMPVLRAQVKRHASRVPVGQPAWDTARYQRLSGAHQHSTTYPSDLAMRPR